MEPPLGAGLMGSVHAPYTACHAPPWPSPADLYFPPAPLIPPLWGRKTERQLRFSLVPQWMNWCWNLSCKNFTQVCQSVYSPNAFGIGVWMKSKGHKKLQEKLLNFSDGRVKISKFSPDPCSNTDSPGSDPWCFQQGWLALGSLRRISNLASFCLFQALPLLGFLLNKM